MIDSRAARRWATGLVVLSSMSGCNLGPVDNRVGCLSDMNTSTPLRITSISAPSHTKVGVPMSVRIDYLGSECSPSVDVGPVQLETVPRPNDEISVYVTWCQYAPNTPLLPSDCSEPGTAYATVTPPEIGTLDIYGLNTSSPNTVDYPATTAYDVVASVDVLP